MKYSVVIPCHNETEANFSRCLDSWKNQTVKPYEVIVVNDCGNKELEKIVNKYGFKYIYNEIKGHHGRARNTGFKEATGDYIISCNADDYVEINEIEEIEKVNKGQDVIMIGLKSFGNENKFGVCSFLPNENNIPYTSKVGIYSEPVHIVNRKFIIDNKIFLRENIKTADVDWVLEVEKKMKTYTYVEKVLYHWNFENKIEADNIIREDVVIYVKDMNVIGGIETWVHEIVKKYSDNRNILFLYKTGDAKQIRRLRKYVDCKIYNNEKIECKTILFCYNMEIIDKVTAEKYVVVVHGDVKYTKLKFNLSNKITNIYAVSKLAQQSFIETHKDQLEKLKLTCELLYNPLTIDKPKKVLRLISATRLSWEKGADRINAMAKRMNELGIPFIWTVFGSNGNISLNIDGLVKLEPKLNITDYIADSDYLLQLSNTESYGYSMVEALCLGIPVVTTDMPVIEEIGIKHGENGFILDFDLKNLDEVIKSMYEKNLKWFKYEQLESDKEYKKILGAETDKRYKFEKTKGFEVIVEKPCFYTLENKQCEKGDYLIIESEARLNDLVNRGYVKEL